jgi:HAD superfamily hydrolase (TIGR01549 family)
MSHPPIILFDFDGVVITQRALEYTSLIFLRKRFYKWKNTENLRLIDIARIFEEADSKNRLKALFNVNKIYKKYIPYNWRRFLFFIRYRRTYPKFEKYESLKPNLEELLTKLKKGGIPLGIVSNTKGKRLDYFRNKLNLDNFFCIYISRNQTPYRKPNPYPIIIALKEIKEKLHFNSIDRNKVYFVGDLPADIECAKNAKVKSIALLSGHGLEEDLRKVNPTIILEDIKDVLEIDLFKKYLMD